MGCHSHGFRLFDKLVFLMDSSDTALFKCPDGEFSLPGFLEAVQKG